MRGIMPARASAQVETQLIAALCLAAGQIMEDASVTCAQVLPDQGSRRSARIRRLRQAGEDIAALLAAAEVLDRRA
jgi:hypothetical protein